MGRGRKSKPGARHKCGKLKQPASPDNRVKGSEWVQARQARFGQHYSSAIGRAYAAGLLGNDERAKERLDAGKRFARVHASVIGGPAYRCALNDAPRGSGGHDDHERQQRDQRWLFAAMDSLDIDGSRPWLDALVGTQNTDNGPVWLDRLLVGGKDPYDRAMLAYAIRALDVIAPARRPMGILAA